MMAFKLSFASGVLLLGLLFVSDANGVIISHDSLKNQEKLRRIALKQYVASRRISKIDKMKKMMELFKQAVTQWSKNIPDEEKAAYAKEMLQLRQRDEKYRRLQGHAERWIGTRFRLEVDHKTDDVKSPESVMEETFRIPAEYFYFVIQEMKPPVLPKDALFMQDATYFIDFVSKQARTRHDNDIAFLQRNMATMELPTQVLRTSVGKYLPRKFLSVQSDYWKDKPFKRYEKEVTYIATHGPSVLSLPPKSSEGMTPPKPVRFFEFWTRNKLMSRKTRVPLTKDQAQKMLMRMSRASSIFLVGKLWERFQKY